MRASLPLRVLRSPWLYLSIGIFALLAAGLVMADWSYNSNDWVRYHVQEVLGQVRALTYTQPDVVPTPAVRAPAPTFAPLPTLAPTAAPTALIPMSCSPRSKARLFLRIVSSSRNSFALSARG